MAEAIKDLVVKLGYCKGGDFESRKYDVARGIIKRMHNCLVRMSKPMPNLSYTHQVVTFVDQASKIAERFEVKELDSFYQTVASKINSHKDELIDAKKELETRARKLSMMQSNIKCSVAIVEHMLSACKNAIETGDWEVIKGLPLEMLKQNMESAL